MDELEQALQDFLVASIRFCRAVESVPSLPLKDFLSGLDVAFSELYSAGARLPDVEPDRPDLERQHRTEIFARLRAARQGLPSPDPRDHGRWELLDATQDKLGDLDRFWKVPDPTKPEQPDDDPNFHLHP